MLLWRHVDNPMKSSREGPEIERLEEYWALMSKAEHRILDGKAGIKIVYDEMADLYDRSEYLYWTRRMEEGEERTTREWIRFLSTPVLDVGCGTGRYTIKIARKGSDAVSLDLSLRMLKETIKKSKELDCYDHVSPVLADAERLPFRESSLSGLICAFTFDHFENCDSIAREFSRVLRSEGLCILTTFNPYTLNDLKRRAEIPLDKIRFQTEEMPPTLVYEVGHSADEINELFTRYDFLMTETKGSCYWHFLPMSLIRRYPTELDVLFNIFNPLLRYAEIHATLLRKH
jgi:ubiquinone/menaquinone biosynthesis C-methylase UbiE